MMTEAEFLGLVNWTTSSGADETVGMQRGYGGPLVHDVSDERSFTRGREGGDPPGVRTSGRQDVESQNVAAEADGRPPSVCPNM